MSSNLKFPEDSGGTGNRKNLKIARGQVKKSVVGLELTFFLN